MFKVDKYKVLFAAVWIVIISLTIIDAIFFSKDNSIEHSSHNVTTLCYSVVADYSLTIVGELRPSVLMLNRFEYVCPYLQGTVFEVLCSDNQILGKIFTPLDICSSQVVEVHSGSFFSSQIVQVNTDNFFRIVGEGGFHYFTVETVYNEFLFRGLVGFEYRAKKPQVR